MRRKMINKTSQTLNQLLQQLVEVNHLFQRLTGADHHLKVLGLHIKLRQHFEAFVDAEVVKAWVDDKGSGSRSES